MGEPPWGAKICSSKIFTFYCLNNGHFIYESRIHMVQARLNLTQTHMGAINIAFHLSSVMTQRMPAVHLDDQ